MQTSYSPPDLGTVQTFFAPLPRIPIDQRVGLAARMLWSGDPSWVMFRRSLEGERNWLKRLLRTFLTLLSPTLCTTTARRCPVDAPRLKSDLLAVAIAIARTRCKDDVKHGDDDDEEEGVAVIWPNGEPTPSTPPSPPPRCPLPLAKSIRWRHLHTHSKRL